MAGCSIGHKPRSLHVNELVCQSKQSNYTSNTIFVFRISALFVNSYNADVCLKGSVNRGVSAGVRCVFFAIVSNGNAAFFIRSALSQ